MRGCSCCSNPPASMLRRPTPKPGTGLLTPAPAVADALFVGAGAIGVTLDSGVDTRERAITLGSVDGA